jgi:hypothetical protein
MRLLNQKELGALRRAREIKTPDDLLKLIFLYLTEGKSFGNTLALLRREPDAAVSIASPSSKVTFPANPLSNLGFWGITLWNFAHPKENWKDIAWYKEINGLFLKS